MPKTKPTKRTADRAKERAKKKVVAAAPPPEGTPVPKSAIPHMFNQEILNHLPVYFQALQALHEEQVKTNALLAEIRDALKE